MSAETLYTCTFLSISIYLQAYMYACLFFLVTADTYLFGSFYYSKNAFLYRWLFAGIPVFLCFVAYIIIMIQICSAVIAQTAQSDRYRSELWQSGRRPGQTRTESATNESRLQRLMMSIFPSNAESVVEAGGTNFNLSLSLSRANAKKREVKQQAMLFIGAFLITASMTYVNRVTEQVVGSSPFWLQWLARFLNGLQGFFNIIVYTKPHVASLRRRHQNYSWFNAFFKVVMKGGDHDRIHSSRRHSSVASRSSLVSRSNKRRRSSKLPPERKERNLLLSKNRTNQDGDDDGIEPGDINAIMNTVASINNGKSLYSTDSKVRWVGDQDVDQVLSDLEVSERDSSKLEEGEQDYNDIEENGTLEVVEEDSFD